MPHGMDGGVLWIHSCEHDNADSVAALRHWHLIFRASRRLGWAGAGLALRPGVADSPTLCARLFPQRTGQMVLGAVFQMDPLRVWQATSSDLAVTCDISVKTSALLTCRIVDPREFLSLHDAVSVVICKRLKRRLGSLPAPAPNFLSPRIHSARRVAGQNRDCPKFLERSSAAEQRPDRRGIPSRIPVFIAERRAFGSARRAP
jgi:hypothetical protein